MKKYILCVFFFTFIAGGFSQSAMDNVNLSKFNDLLLDSLIIDKTNKIRAKDGLVLLEQDGDLYKPALLQAKYVLRKRKIVHKQSSKKKKTPIDRVKFYGGMHHIVGEDIEKIPLFVKTKIKGDSKHIILKTYNDVARAIVASWEYQKGKHNNIKDQDYYKVNVAVVVDRAKEVIYAVQLYASHPFPLKEEMKIPKNDYGLKEEDKICKSFRKKYPFLPELLSDNLVVENNQLYFQFHDLALLKKVLKSGKDGVAVDAVFRNQFPCFEGNRLFPSKIHNGLLFKPLKKSKIFGGNINKKKGSVKVSFGEMPSFIDEKDTEFNLLLIKKNRVCETIFYNNNDGEQLRNWNLKLIMDTLTYSSDDSDVDRNLEFTVPFQLNKSTYDVAYIKPWLDSLNIHKYDLKKVVVKAYSSIEGDPKKNKLLQQKRANSILEAIQTYQMQDVELAVETAMNWQGFYQEIDKTPYKKFIRGMSKNQLIEYLNSDTLKIDYEPYLKSQRKADVFLTVRREKIEKLPIDKMVDKYQKAIVDDEFFVAKLWQSRLISDVENIDMAIREYEIPVKKANLSLLNNQRVLLSKNEQLNHIDTLEMLLDVFRRYLALNENHAYLKYNVGVVRLMLWQADTARENSKDFGKWLRKIYHSSIEKNKVDFLWANYLMQSSDYYYDTGNMDERDRQLKKLFRLVTQIPLTESENYAIAKFFMFQLKTSMAIKVMLPIIKSDSYSEDYLFSFLKIAMYDKKLVPESTFVSLMNKAQQMNSNRFCKLFGYPNMSFQLLRTDAIKAAFCTHCGADE